MIDSARLPNHQSIRKRGWNYAAAGWYFVTINTHEGRALFGTIVNGRMVLNESGRMVEKIWKNLPQFYTGMGIDEAVVMPNHFHGIVRIIGQDEMALANIRNYFRSNPQNYEAVMNVGEPHLLGNAVLLDMPKMGFLASRGETQPHGHLAMKTREAIISGFLSPMERAVLKAGLEHKRPLIWVKPWGFAVFDAVMLY